MSVKERYKVAPWWWFWGVKDNSITIRDGDDPQADRVWGSSSRAACVRKCAELNAQQSAVQP